jgi:prepilin-type N-terminal cleavage/methylation domain-containing protein
MTRTPLRAPTREEHGFTLVEMLVTMFIIGVVFAAFGTVVSTTLRHSAAITNQTVVQHEARSALNQLTADLREATLPTTTATSPFVTTGGVMSSTTLTFYAPDDSYNAASPTAYHMREISYQLSGGNFQRVSAVSSNTSGTWTIPALGSYVPLVGGVVNSAAFTYYDGSQPPVATTSPAAVRTVVVTLKVSVPGTSQQYTYSTSATLRENSPT